jgi:hypothetical protein
MWLVRDLAAPKPQMAINSIAWTMLLCIVSVMKRGLLTAGTAGSHGYKLVVTWLLVCAFALQGVLAHHHFHDTTAASSVAIGEQHAALGDGHAPADRPGHPNDANCPGCVVAATTFFVMAVALVAVAPEETGSAGVLHLVLDRTPESLDLTRSSRGPPAILNS